MDDALEFAAKVFLFLLFIVGIVGLGALLMKDTSPAGRAIYNANEALIEEVDDATSYHKKKEVEDTCRASIVNYTKQKMTYEQYKDHPSADMRAIAEKSKILANSTAANYNEYILKNSHVFKGNIPADIQDELPYIE